MAVAFSVRFDESTNEQLEHLASTQGISKAEVVRMLTQKSLNPTVCQQNIDFLSGIIREQIKYVVDPAINRLAALSAKTCVQAGTAAYLTAETLAQFVPIELQQDYMEAYETARKKAVSYTSQKLEKDTIQKLSEE